MGDELVVQGGLPARLSHQGRKQMESMQQDVLLAQTRMGSVESIAYYQARIRARNGYQLAREVANEAIELNHLIEHRARGNPALEANLRTFVEEPIMLAAADVAVRYVTRPQW